MKNLKSIVIIMSLLLLSINAVCNEHENEVIEKKVVYDLTTSDIKMIEKRLIGSIISNSDYYQSKLQEYKVKVVIHGDAYKFFMADLNNTAYAFDKSLVKKKEELEKRLKSLSTLYAVEFEVCGVGVKSRDLNPKAFYRFTSIIHNAIVGLVDAQNDGYAYVPID
jgi:hypothetical protein